METMWTIVFGGFLLLSGVCFVNSESESEDLLQEILASLQDDANDDFTGTPSTTATVDPLKLATVSSQKIFSNATDNNQTLESRTDNNSLDQLLSADNKTTSSASLSQSDDKLSDQALESLTTTPVSKYSSSSYDDVTAHPGLSFSSTTLNPTEQLCSTRNILQSLCREDLPSLVKIANIWDVYNVLFSDDVINELLLNCPSGEWCLRDEFDIFRAKMAEKADMVLHSAVFADTCEQVSLGCLENVVRQLELCSFGERLNFTLEAVKLMCSLKDITSTNLECTSQVLSALHVTIMDILRKENEKQDLNPAFENDVCRSTEGLMTQTYLCVCSKCPDNMINALSRFRPWSWFLGDVEKLKVTCHFENNTCVSRDTVFILDEASPTTSTLSVPQADDTWFNQDSGLVDIRSSPVALVGIGTAVVIMTVGMTAFVILFVKRHRMTSRSHDYRPLETDDP